MKKLIIGILISVFMVGCSSSNSKWTFSDKDYETLLSNARSFKDNFDMYVEKENRGLDYTEELETNVELTKMIEELQRGLKEKYGEKLTDEENSILADLYLACRYVRYNFRSDNEYSVRHLENVKKAILKLEEE